MHTKKNIACLDGLRALACVLVLFSHAGWQKFFYFVEPLGPLGICLFFTLSGFLMAYHYMPASFSWRYWAAFLLRRFFRIYPVYALILLLYFTTQKLSPHDHFMSVYTLPVILQHLTLKIGWNTFWTIPVEIHFYLLFPLIACLLLLLKRPLPALLILWSALLIYPLNGALGHVLFFFIGGMAGAIAYKSHHPSTYLSQKHWNFTAFVCLALLTSAIILAFNPMGYTYRWDYTWFLSPLMVLTLISTIESNGLTQRIFSSRAARFTGTISYSLYLIHDYIFHYSLYYRMNPSLKFLLNFALSFAAAWILYELVEKPCNRFGKILTAKLQKNIKY